MIDSPALTLYQVTEKYLNWMVSSGYPRCTYDRYQDELDMFLSFIIRKKINWEDIFTLDMLKHFQQTTQASAGPAVRGLSRYLYERKRILRPIRRTHRRLPDAYENYLRFYEQTRQVPLDNLMRIKKVLCVFYDYLERHHIKLASLRIDQIDAFLGEYFAPFSTNTRQTYRLYLRGFLKYLYNQGIIVKDLAPLVIGEANFARRKPPKFYRPHEIKRLFDSLELSSSRDLRDYAMVHLAYDLGLRPKEISLITLDDVFFSQSEVKLTTRKNDLPAKLPLAETTLKAVAAYVIGARPKTDSRRLFLDFRPPFSPTTAKNVGCYITERIRKAGLPGSAYWLRHSYAQNLLETGVSIYEIKEMMGHGHVDSSEKYLHIHLNLMRRVLFNEEL